MQFLACQKFSKIMKADSFVAGDVLQTLGPCSVTVGVNSEGAVTLRSANGGTLATVTKADIPTCSGVVHIVDRPILDGPVPPGLEPLESA